MIFLSQARRESMALAFAELSKGHAHTVICEVGRLRNPYAAESDGHSTVSFLNFVNEHQGKLISIDNNIETESACLLECGKHGLDANRLEFLTDDALRLFSSGSGEEITKATGLGIDLLYLDGWDLCDPESAKKHLTCFLLAESLVAPGGLVLVDDTGTSDLGKGKLIIPVAVLMGWKILFQGYQVLLRKP